MYPSENLSFKSTCLGRPLKPGMVAARIAPRMPQNHGIAPCASFISTIARCQAWYGRENKSRHYVCTTNITQNGGHVYYRVIYLIKSYRNMNRIRYCGSDFSRYSIRKSDDLSRASKRRFTPFICHHRHPPKTSSSCPIP